MAGLPIMVLTLMDVSIQVSGILVG